MKFIHQPSGIIHVGAGEMEEADYYRSLKNPDVTWIEARPITEWLDKKALDNRHVLLQAVFSDTSSNATFHITDNGHSSSLLPLRDHPGVTEQLRKTVTTIRADEFFGHILPALYDTLVLDVQGAELKVLKGFGKLLDGFEWIMSEVFYSEVYEYVPMCGEVLAFLEDKGFELVQEEKHCSGLWGDILVKRTNEDARNYNGTRRLGRAENVRPAPELLEEPRPAVACDVS